MATDWPRNLRILAFKEALSKSPSAEFSFRKLFRWYSKTFATPLHMVEKLPLYDILQAYYEDYAITLIEAGDNESHLKLQTELEDLCKTEEELVKEQLEKAKNEVLDRKALEEMGEGNQQANKLSQLNKKKKLEEKLRRDQQANREVNSLMNKDGLGSKISNSPIKPTQPIDDTFDDGFSMSFVGLDEVGEIDGFREK